MFQVYNMEWRRRNPERSKAINERSTKKNPERYRRMKKYMYHRWVETTRLATLGHYSNQNYKCACCGQSERDFLVIDHIDGHGNQHRKEIFGSPQAGYRFYDWLIKHGYPLGYQVLCYNCNASKGKHGKCVHVASPSKPTPPPDMRTVHRRTGDQKPRGYEASLVDWRPRS
jgi:hypothetical protein